VPDLPPEVLAHYERDSEERIRLTAGHGVLEFLRTQELLARCLRPLTAAAGTIDAVLELGPLYHLVERGERLAALREARRVLRPGGVVAAAIISRFGSTADGLRFASSTSRASTRSWSATCARARTSSPSTGRSCSRRRTSTGPTSGRPEKGGGRRVDSRRPPDASLDFAA
jgi:SAM-dependent methyltransferase